MAVDISYPERELTFEKASDVDSPEFQAIVDRFTTLKDVRMAIKNCGVDKCRLIFGIDYTLSNRLQGQKTFGGLNLHDTEHGNNPYQEVICVLGETLEALNTDGSGIPAFGFGDREVKDHGIFTLNLEGEELCEGFEDVINVYNKRTPHIHLGGPTNFAPLINKAIEIVKKTKQYHILVICADGQVTNEEDTTEAIIKASQYPLSIVTIGVGDGPWEEMIEFDDELPARQFDNFQFVDLHKVKTVTRNPHAALALAALMEIPDQYEIIQKLKLIEKL